MYIPLCVFNTITSTNDYAKEIINNFKNLHNCALYSYEQTKGRGRIGNTWISTYGNIHFTLIIKKKDFVTNNNQINILSLATSLAVKQTLSKYLSKQQVINIKWPNDILINHEKISGILIEQESNIFADYLIIGIGINIFNNPIINNYKTVCLKNISNKSLNSLQITLELLDNLLQYYNKLNNKQVIIQQYLQSLYKLNESITVKYNNTTIYGTLLGINNNGHLILNTKNEEIQLLSGEII